MRKFIFKVDGERALFTNPAFRTERHSYDAPTRSALAGVLGAVLWKPEMEWNIHWVEILSRVQRASVMINEVYLVPARPGHVIMVDETDKNGRPANRTQRTSSILRQVSYRFCASIGLTDLGRERGYNVRKYEDMFLRNFERGRHSRCPYLGIKEYTVSDLRMGEGDGQPIKEDIEIGVMHWGKRKIGKEVQNLFFHAIVRDGRLEFPSPAQIQREGFAIRGLSCQS